MACVYWARLPEHTDILKDGYVGFSSKSAESRWADHQKTLRDKKSQRLPFYRALKKFKDKIILETIAIGDNAACLRIERGLRPSPMIGWNVAVGGESGSLGFHPSLEIRENMRQGQMGRKLSEETKQKIRMKAMGHKRNVGRPNTEKQKELIRQKAIGRRHSEATRKLLREQRIGIPLPSAIRAKMIREKTKVVKCPHCGKIGQNGGMKRHHFSHCKDRKDG